VDRERLTFAAASMRFVLALFAMLTLPSVFPWMNQYTWVFGAYIALAAVFQWMIWKDVGGTPRALAAGFVDLGMITFVVHCVGSGASMMVSLYFFAVMMNIVVVGQRVGMWLGVLGAACYDGLVLAEAGGLLPYAPARPAWAAGRPALVEAMGYGLIMTVMLLALSAVVGALVEQIAARQRELEEANAKLKELSLRDPLTQLYNRRYLMERLEAEIARVRRGRKLAVVMVDLDRFKRVNDDTGHARGDALLQELARALTSSVRETDVVGRYGGDEFVVVLPDTDGAQASSVADRIVQAIREVGVRFDPIRPVTASVGLAIATPDDEPRALLQRADGASYDAKLAGGDRVSLELPPSGASLDAREQHPQ
jgi:diguanylate cyclase (GGDEF)-like protein